MNDRALRPCPAVASWFMDPVVAASWVAVAGTLGGVVVGGGLEWVRARGAERRAAAARRDELYVSLLDACDRLFMEAVITQTVAGRPPEVVETRRRVIAPLLSDVIHQGVRLSLTGDEAKAAADGLVKAASALMAHVDERDEDYTKRLEEAGAARDQVWRARDVGRARWWRRRKMRRRVTDG